MLKPVVVVMTLPAESVTVASRGTVVTAVLWAAASEAPDAAPDAACEAPEATAWEALATAEVRMGMAARGEPLADWATPEGGLARDHGGIGVM